MPSTMYLKLDTDNYQILPASQIDTINSVYLKWILVIVTSVSILIKNTEIVTNVLSCTYTVNPEIFARILFSRIALKDIFAALKFTLRA